MTVMKLTTVLSILCCNVSVSSNWVHPLPGQPLGIPSNNCPGDRDLTFESCPGAGNSTRAGILWNCSNYVKRHINVCSGRDLCSPFLTIFLRRPCMKVGLKVRISLVRVLFTRGGGAGESFPPPKKKVFLKKKVKSYFKH